MSIENDIRKHYVRAKTFCKLEDFHAANRNLTTAELTALRHGIRLPEEYYSLKRTVNELGVKEYTESAIQQVKRGNFDAADDDLVIAEYIASEHDINLPEGYESLKRTVKKLGVKKYIESPNQQADQARAYFLHRFKNIWNLQDKN